MPISPRIKEYLLAKTNPALATALSLEKVREIVKQIAKETMEKEIKGLLMKAEEAIYRELTLIDKEANRQLKTALKGDKGDKGDSIKGDKGDTTIVEKIIEKTEIIKEQPIVKEIVKVTNEIKEVAVTDKPEIIADKLNTLEEKVNKNVIIGLEKSLKDLKDSVRKGGGKKGGGMGNVIHETKSVSSATTTITTDYSIAGAGYAIWAFYQSGNIVRGTHYTVGSDFRTLTLTFTPQDSTFIDLIYIR